MLRRILFTFALLTIVVGQVKYTLAAPVTIGTQQWRQLTDTTGYSWNALSNEFDVTDGTHTGSVADFTGWKWASSAEVGSMLSTVTGKSL